MKDFVMMLRTLVWWAIGTCATIEKMGYLWSNIFGVILALIMTISFEEKA